VYWEGLVVERVEEARKEEKVRRGERIGDLKVVTPM